MAAPQVDVPMVPAVPSMGVAAMVATVPTAVPIAGAAALDMWHQVSQVSQVAVDVLSATSTPTIALAQGGRDTTFNDYMKYVTTP